MAHNSNWVKINRSIFDNFIWKKNTPFDYRSAWIDLILLANHEDGEFLTSRGELIKVPRGAHFTSIRSLSERWHWSKQSVVHFLHILCDAQMITQCGTKSGTLLCLVNYSEYQGGKDTGRYTNKDTMWYTNEDTNEDTGGVRTRIEEEKNERIEEAFSSSFDYGSEDDDENDYWNEVNDDDERRSEKCIPDDRRELDIPPRTFNYADKVRKLIYGIERLSDPRGGTGDSECDS